MTDFCWMTDIKQLMDIVSPSSAPLPPLSWGGGKTQKRGDSTAIYLSALPSQATFFVFLQ